VIVRSQAQSTETRPPATTICGIILAPPCRAAELEIDSLVAELSRASGLGGRSRVAASGSERARQSVTRAIKDALSRIAGCHPSLGRALARQIKTGTYCSDQPDLVCKVRWSLAAPASDMEYSGEPLDEQGPATGAKDRYVSFALGSMPPSSAEVTTAENGETTATLNHITSMLHRAFVQFASPPKSPRSATRVWNVILMVVNSAPLFDNMGKLAKQSRERSDAEMVISIPS
jgi:hypothetical protein